MTLTSAPIASPSAPRANTLANGGVVIATLNRLEGATGVHTHTRSLHDGLRAAGVPCTVVTPFSGSRAWQPIFAVRPLLLNHVHPTWATRWYRHWHMAALRANLRKTLREGSISNIITQCPPSARVAMDLRDELGLSDRVRVTMVCHFNRSEADEYRDLHVLNRRAYGRMLAFEESTIRGVDRVAYVSAWARELVEQERGIKTRGSAVIWNGISEVAPIQQPLSRNDLGLSEHDLLLTSVGTLEPRKNQLGLVHLFAKIAAEYPAAKLLLVGEGADRTAIEAAIAQHSLGSKIKLLGHRKDVPAILEFSDLYIHNASLENCPIVLLEAARAGLPWAAKSAGGVTELLHTLKGGVGLDARDEAESLITLRPLLASADHRKSLGRSAKECFERQFTQTTMVRAYMQLMGLTQGAS